LSYRAGLDVVAELLTELPHLLFLIIPLSPSFFYMYTVTVDKPDI